MYTSSSWGNIKDHKIYTIEFTIKIYYIRKVHKNSVRLYYVGYIQSINTKGPLPPPTPMRIYFPHYSTFQSTAQTSQYYILTHYLRLQSTLTIIVWLVYYVSTIKIILNRHIMYNIAN